MQANSLSRCAVLTSLLGRVALALGGCAATLPPLPFRRTPVPNRITVRVGDAYSHVEGSPSDPRQSAGVQLVPDPALQRWIMAAAATLRGKVVFNVRAADTIHGTFWQEATPNTAGGSGQNLSRILTELIGSFSLVLGLGLLPSAQAATNTARALLALMRLTMARPR